MKINKKLKSIA